MRCGKNDDIKFVKNANISIRQCPVDNSIVHEASFCSQCPYGLVGSNCSVCLHDSLTNLNKKASEKEFDVKIVKAKEIDSLMEKIDFKSHKIKISTVNDPITIYDTVVKNNTSEIGLVLGRNSDNSLNVLWENSKKSSIVWDIEVKKVDDSENKDKEIFKGGEKPDSLFDEEALLKGMEVESEHTDDPEKQKEIAKGHLVEDSNYYEKHEKCGL